MMLWTIAVPQSTRGCCDLATSVSAGRGALGVHVHRIQRLARGHEQPIALGPAEGDVRTDLRQADPAEQRRRRAPHRDAAIADAAPGVARTPHIAVNVGADA